MNSIQFWDSIMYSMRRGIGPSPRFYNSVKFIDDYYTYLSSITRLLQEEGKLVKRLLATSSFPLPQWDVTHALMASSAPVAIGC